MALLFTIPPAFFFFLAELINILNTRISFMKAVRRVILSNLE